ncbi:DUF2946 family protein [Rhodoferax sediminis]|uniref:DUF2946 domain-containing protein n=1 Tax=Rhodoferax sediminis TaxID=2509614 RepID=A0A515DFR4_9BURK|nr:DUF2946 family protein [Rhodoferax sediminis]QDL39263.1 DUF2946 domain-containing protein [Rhodoferax sediminis]
MHALRHAHFLARWVLVCVVLAIGAAVASPLIKPQTMELVCSGAGTVKLLIKTDDGGSVGDHTLHCPLCASLGAPPPRLRVAAEPFQPLSYVLQPIAAAHIAALTAAPLPARGPPVFS